MKDVGLSVNMFLNKEVQTARYAENSQSALIQLQTKQREELVDVMVNMSLFSACARSQQVEIVQIHKDMIHTAIFFAMDLAIGATQTMLLLGRPIPAYYQLIECEKILERRPSLVNLELQDANAVGNLDE